MSTFTEGTESQQDQNFSQDDNDVPPKKGRETTLPIIVIQKLRREIYTSVSYRRFKQSDFNTSSLIVDILSFLIQNSNPINLDRKVDNEKEKDMLKFVWDECISNVFIT